MMYLQSQTRGALMVRGKGLCNYWSFSHDLLLLLLAFPVVMVWGQNTDLFNYEGTRDWEEGKDYGPRQWDQVECDDLEECVRSFGFGSGSAFPSVLLF